VARRTPPGDGEELSHGVNLHPGAENSLESCVCHFAPVRLCSGQAYCGIKARYEIPATKLAAGNCGFGELCGKCARGNGLYGNHISSS